MKNYKIIRVSDWRAFQHCKSQTFFIELWAKNFLRFFFISILKFFIQTTTFFCVEMYINQNKKNQNWLEFFIIENNFFFNVCDQISILIIYKLQITKKYFRPPFIRNYFIVIKTGSLITMFTHKLRMRPGTVNWRVKSQRELIPHRSNYRSCVTRVRDQTGAPSDVVREAI